LSNTEPFKKREKMGGLTIKKMPVGVLLRYEGPYLIRTTIELYGHSQTTYLELKSEIEKDGVQEFDPHRVTIKEDQYQDFIELMTQAIGLAINFVENGTN
jgi:hypothetical protein